MKKRVFLIILGLVIGFLLAFAVTDGLAQDNSPSTWTVTPPPEPTATNTPLPTETSVPTVTPDPTATSEPSPIPSATLPPESTPGGPPDTPTPFVITPFTTSPPLPSPTATWVPVTPVLGTPSTNVPKETPSPTKKRGQYNTFTPTPEATWMALPVGGERDEVSKPGELEYDQAWWDQITEFIIVIGLFIVAILTLIGIFYMLKGLAKVR